MNKKHLTLLPLCILLLSAGPLNYDEPVKDPAIYYVPDKNYEIKNFAILDGSVPNTAFSNKGRVVTFDICLNKITDSKKLYLTNDAIDNANIVNPSITYVDGRLGKQFQKVILPFGNLDPYIRAKRDYRVMCDNEILFTFNASKFMLSGETREYEFEEFENTVKFTFPSSRQLIVDNKFQYMNDYIEISHEGISKLRNYYFGRIANEYLLVKYYNDYDKYLSPELKQLYFGIDNNLMSISLYIDDYSQFEKLSKSDYTGENFTFKADKKFKDYNRFIYDTSRNRFHTYEDGQMKRLLGPDDKWTKTNDYNPSKSVTFSMNDISHERLYNSLCKSNVDFQLMFGMENSNWIKTRFRLTPQYDYFYNHMQSYHIDGTFNNDEVKGIDKHYA